MTSKSTSQSTTESVVAVVKGLEVLIEHTKKDLCLKKEPPVLSHYRNLPEQLQTAYALLHQGATLVRATATKYALVGAIDVKDQGSLGTDLLKGCELIGAASHVTMQDPSGCSHALRQHTQKAALAVFIATLRLVEAFHPEIISSMKQSKKQPTTVVATASTISVASKDNNVGAQKTGALWEACDHILNKRLPQGNRNAMRRELFTWTRECNDTMEEFQEMIELGPKETAGGDAISEDDEDDCGWGGSDDDQYSEDELPMAKACLGLLKNSRGNMKVSLEACEALGKLEADEANLTAIACIYKHAKKVGEGVTDLGSLLYPPLLAQASELQDGVVQQTSYIVEFQEYLLGLDPPLPSKISDLAQTLKNAAEKRGQEFLDALNHCQGGSDSS